MDVRRKKPKHLLLGILFLSPALILIIVTSFIPYVSNLILSFQKWDGFLNRKWVFLDNYIKFFTSASTLRYLYNSVFLAFTSTIGSVLFGFILALILVNLNNRFGTFSKLVFYLPGLIPTAILAMLFSFILNPEMGILNNVLKLVGLGKFARAWLEDRRTAMNCVVIFNIWKSCGMTMILTYAAVKLIPSSLFESCDIDGGGYFRKTFNITIPLVKPYVGTAMLFTLSGCFRTYDSVYALTGGGPSDITRTIPINMVYYSFNYGEFGYAASMGVVLSLVVMASLLLVLSIFGGKQYEI